MDVKFRLNGRKATLAQGVSLWWLTNLNEVHNSFSNREIDFNLNTNVKLASCVFYSKSKQVMFTF